jgi:hypothetical protein
MHHLRRTTMTRRLNSKTPTSAVSNSTDHTNHSRGNRQNALNMSRRINH